MIGKLVSAIRKWGEFVKFSHTLFAMPFALASMMVAKRENQGWPGWDVFLLILLALVSARTCGMAFNRIVDRQFDGQNPRTANRHLPTGRITLTSAWTLCILGGCAFVACSKGLNMVCFVLSPVVLALVLFYSFTKRFTHYTHLYLGAALAIAPVEAWLAVRGGLSLWPWHMNGIIPIPPSGVLPLVLAGAVFFWLIGFDIIYSIQDYEFDRAHGLHSLVVAWGPNNALKATFICHVLMWGLLALYGLLAGFRVAYFVGQIVILVCLVMEHWIARKRKLKWINLAFFRLNALIGVVFFVVVLVEIQFPNFRIVR